MMTSTWGGHKLIDALHGGGSPVIEKVAIYRDHNLEHSKNMAKKLAGIPCEECTKGFFRAKNRWYYDKLRGLLAARQLTAALLNGPGRRSTGAENRLLCLR